MNIIKDTLQKTHKNAMWILSQNFVKEKLKKIQKKDKNLFDKTISNLKKIKWPKYTMVDAHLHIVDFVWNTPWLKDLLYYMDKSNISKAVIFGTSLKKIWLDNERQRPDYYLDDDNACYYDSFTDTIVAREYLSLSKKDRERFYPLLCWFNPLDIDSVKYIEKVFKYYPWVFCGIWEILYRHDDLTHMTYWEPPRMNTIATAKLLEFASNYDLPVMIHNNITSVWVSEYPKYLHEFEVMIRDFPRAKVVLAHCWASRRLQVPYYSKIIDRLLTEYDNLYVDYSWVVFEDVITISDDIMEDWLKLTEKFYDRVMIWSDILGDAFHKIWVINAKYDKFMDKLTPKTREHLCSINAINLYSNKNKLENNQKISFPLLENLKNKFWFN